MNRRRLQRGYPPISRVGAKGRTVFSGGVTRQDEAAARSTQAGDQLMEVVQQCERLIGQLRAIVDDIRKDRPITKQELLESTLQTVAHVCDVPSDVILSGSRLAQVVRARFLLVRALHHHNAGSQNEIGALLGRDHSAIGYALKTAEDWMQTDRDFAGLWHRVEEDLKAKLGVQEVKDEGAG